MSFEPQPPHHRQDRQDVRPLPQRSDSTPGSTHGIGEREARGGEGSTSKFLVYGLIILALLASLFMIFLDSDLWLKIAVFAALWAAFIGAVLMMRYSAQLTAERERNNELERSHRAELDREKSEFEKREKTLEADYELRMRDQRDEQIEQLRHELEIMRQQLAAMTGKDFGDEQIAVRARAERVRELSAEPSPAPKRSTPRMPSPAATARGMAAQGQSQTQPAPAHAKPQPEPAAPRTATRFTTGSFDAIKWDGQDREETTQLPLIVDTTALDDETREPATGIAAPTSHSVHHHAAPDTMASVKEEPAAGAHRRSGGHHRKPEPEDTTGRRGKRRADEATSGLTVAELMARFTKDK